MVERPRSLTGPTTSIETGCGTLYVTESEGLTPEGKTYREIKCVMGKSGGCQACMMDAITGILTLARTAGVSKKSLINVMRGIQCPNMRVSGGVKSLSCPDAIAIVLAAGNKPLGDVPAFVPFAEALPPPEIMPDNRPPTYLVVQPHE
jgi:ribonucleoside-diphosphate reductase alpha chain